MDVRQVHPKTAEHPIEIDQCSRCGGLWLDRDEALPICPTFAKLDERHYEIVALGGKGQGIARCPRCAEIPFEFAIIHLKIDYCPGCAGVWLDAAELKGHTPGLDGPQAELVGGSPYRAIEHAAKTEWFNCTRCGGQARVAETYMTAGGLVCRACYLAASTAAQQQRAEAPGDHPWVAKLISELAAAAKHLHGRGELRG